MWGFTGWRWNLPDPPARRAFEILQQQWLVSKTLPTFAVDPHVLEAQRHSWLPSALPELGTFAGLPDFFAERPLLDDVLSRTNSFVGQLGDALGANVGRIIEWPEVMIPIGALADIGGVMSNLPSIWDFSAITEEFRQAMEEARSGEDVLEETHYGFADDLWNTVFLRAFAHVDPKVRHPVVTNKLVAFTRSEAFADTLLGEVESSRMLRRRRLVIEAVLKAHRMRDYRLSIPALLPQIEGAVLDTMFLKDLVVKEDDRYYLVDENGERRRNRKTKKPLGPVTLGPAITNAELGEEENLAAASEFVSGTLIQRRNAVLHGRDVSYGRAKFSVQALLVLFVLARSVTDLERG